MIIPNILNSMNGTDVIHSWNVASVIITMNVDIIIQGDIPNMNTHNSVVIANNVLFNKIFIILLFSQLIICFIILIYKSFVIIYLIDNILYR